jgi:hypothetical protein
MNSTGPLTTYGNAPAPRGGHTATFVGKKLFVFGGSSYSAKTITSGGRDAPLSIVKSDLHVLDLPSMTWSIPSIQGTQPPARYAHTATLMGNKLIVFGGFNGRSYLDDLNILDTSMYCLFVVSCEVMVADVEGLVSFSCGLLVVADCCCLMSLFCLSCLVCICCLM